MKFINAHMQCQQNAESEAQRRKVPMKRLAESNESWGAGGKCRDSCRSAELEAEFQIYRRRDREAVSA